MESKCRVDAFASKHAQTWSRFKMSFGPAESCPQTGTKQFCSPRGSQFIFSDSLTCINEYWEVFKIKYCQNVYFFQFGKMVKWVKNGQMGEKWSNG